MKILICEDEEILLVALEFRLRKQGFDIVKAENGKIALELIENENPDLIVADLMMPHVTGMQLIEYVRNEKNDPTPIIIISAIEEENTILEAIQKGANDFIGKPFRPNELIVRIKKIFQEKEEPHI